MDFINGDFTLELNADIQNTAINIKSDENTRKMNKYFNYHYDVISCHFSFHYFLRTEETLEQTIKNMDKLLNNNGYVILTLFDGKLVDKFLGNKESVESYININGIKTLVHKITKRYDNKKVIKKDNKTIFKCGNAIDVYVGEGGINETEYLVDPDYLIERMRDHNFELVETELFENIYNNYRQYINEVSLVETKPEMKKFLEKIKPYYEDNETNRECFKITCLNRYYVFKKINK